MMQGLRGAILVAAKFALPQRGREVSPLSGIRLIPRTAAHPARVYATCGTAAILVDVEGDLPNLVADRVGIESALAADPDADVRFADNQIAIGRYRFQPWCPVERFPGLPELPGAELFQSVPDLSPVQKVLHALGKDPFHPEFHHVSFRPGYIEATNELTLARVPAGVNRSFQVHGDVFEQWRSGPVDVAVDRGLSVVFRWDGEVRWGRLYTEQLQPYPDLTLFGQDRKDQLVAVVPVGSLRKAVKKAAAHSASRAVTLRFREGRVGVESGGEAARKETNVVYRDETPALCVGERNIAINGTMLVAALDALETPRALLGVCEPYEPLSVRGGAYAEYICSIID